MKKSLAILLSEPTERSRVNVAYPENTRGEAAFLGRSGTGKCSGIEIYGFGEGLHLVPSTSKGIPARCRIEIPGDPKSLREITGHLVMQAEAI